MSRLLSLLRAHPLLIGFSVALVPVVLMLTMQYVWLSRLKQASGIAHQAALRNCLESVGIETELYYRSTAERLLNVPASLFRSDDVAAIAPYWKSKPHRGVHRLFVVDYTKVKTGNFYIFDPATSELLPTTASDESLAIVLAALPWQARAMEPGPPPSTGIQVDESDASHRIVMSPVLDEWDHAVGIAGMILDNDYFQNELVPLILERTLPAFFTDEVREDVEVRVRDGQGKIVLGAEAREEMKATASSRLPFVFADWTLELTSSGATRYASAAFASNMALSVLLALVLLAGVTFALWGANRAVKLSAMKSDFVSNVSHELRTPLASIRVFAELLRHGKTTAPEKVREYGETIEAETRRLSRLIENILDFSRIESKRKEYRFAPTDAIDLVLTVAESLRVRLERAGFSLTLDLPDKSCEVSLDADAIGQALHNLIDNAAKYSEAPADITVSVRPDGDGLVIAVSDQGIGIAPQDQRKIFDRFHRVSTGLVHNVKGSGLGLAIVTHVVQAHGGSVEVDSEPGRGSIFAVRLPLGSDAPCADAAAQER